MHYLGIDPGKKGSLCLMKKDKSVVELVDFTKMSYPEIARLLDSYKIKRAVIEKVGSQDPKESAASMFTFGYETGRVTGLLDGLLIPYQRVRPQDWQKGLGVRSILQGADRKKALKQVAQERYPHLTNKITLNTCDSILLAEWLCNND